jgi:hypothetical protein
MLLPTFCIVVWFGNRNDQSIIIPLVEVDYSMPQELLTRFVYRTGNGIWFRKLNLGVFLSADIVLEMVARPSILCHIFF